MAGKDDNPDTMRLRGLSATRDKMERGIRIQKAKIPAVNVSVTFTAFLLGSELVFFIFSYTWISVADQDFQIGSID